MQFLAIAVSINVLEKYFYLCKIILKAWERKIRPGKIRATEPVPPAPRVQYVRQSVKQALIPTSWACNKSLLTECLASALKGIVETSLVMKWPVNDKKRGELLLKSSGSSLK